MLYWAIVGVERRLGISAETVERIVENQLAEDRQIDQGRVIKDVGMDEMSLKKRHRLYVTVMTDLSDPGRLKVLAVARGKDTAAALQCLVAGGAALAGADAPRGHGQGLRRSLRRSGCSTAAT